MHGSGASSCMHELALLFLASTYLMCEWFIILKAAVYGGIHEIFHALQRDDVKSDTNEQTTLTVWWENFHIQYFKLI